MKGEKLPQLRPPVDGIGLQTTHGSCCWWKWSSHKAPTTTPLRQEASQAVWSMFLALALSRFNLRQLYGRQRKLLEASNRSDEIEVASACRTVPGLRGVTMELLSSRSRVTKGLQGRATPSEWANCKHDGFIYYAKQKLEKPFTVALRKVLIVCLCGAWARRRCQSLSLVRLNRAQTRKAFVHNKWLGRVVISIAGHTRSEL